MKEPSNHGWSWKGCEGFVKWRNIVTWEGANGYNSRNTKFCPHISLIYHTSRGVKCISRLFYNDMRRVLIIFLYNFIKDTIRYTKHSLHKNFITMNSIYSLHKTMITMDSIHAFKGPSIIL